MKSLKLFHEVSNLGTDEFTVYGSEFAIQSILDLDLYKLVMCQFVYFKWRKQKAMFQFKNRTVSVPLPKCINIQELQRQINHVRNLRLTKEEADWMQSLKEKQGIIFHAKFIRFLMNNQLPPVKIVDLGNTFSIEVEANWPVVTLWETLILTIVNHCYNISVLKLKTPIERTEIFREAKMRLDSKLSEIIYYSGLFFSDFGTRRRFLYIWQKYVVTQCRDRLTESGNFKGTSNCHLAMILDIPVIGTYAHEMDMGYYGIYGSAASHKQMMKDWVDFYGQRFAICLSDTYGTDYAFSCMDKKEAEFWLGFRHDSGDPIEFGEKVIAFYEKYGIDPKEKLIVFSDGLDLPTVIKIFGHFKDRIQVSFGWGTNLTNDMGCGLKTLSIVMKLMKIVYWTVKLSDNIQKAMYHTLEQLNAVKKEVGYEAKEDKECKV